MTGRVEEFAEGQQVPDHEWVPTGQMFDGRPSLACLHCMHGRDNPVHTKLGPNVISLAARRARRTS